MCLEIANNGKKITCITHSLNKRYTQKTRRNSKMESKHMVDKERDVDMSKVEDTVSRMDEGKKDEILASFEEFKSYLHSKVEIGEKMGMSEETLAKTAEKVADYLAAHEDPRNAEENLLKELWKVGEQEERHKLAHMLVRLVK
jgi:hypothetical protein